MTPIQNDSATDLYLRCNRHQIKDDPDLSKRLFMFHKQIKNGTVSRVDPTFIYPENSNHSHNQEIKTPSYRQIHQPAIRKFPNSIKTILDSQALPNLVNPNPANPDRIEIQVDDTATFLASQALPNPVNPNPANPDRIEILVDETATFALLQNRNNGMGKPKKTECSIL